MIRTALFAVSLALSASACIDQEGDEKRTVDTDDDPDGERPTEVPKDVDLGCWDPRIDDYEPNCDPRV